MSAFSQKPTFAGADLMVRFKRLFAQRPDREGHQKADFQRAMESLFVQGKIKVETHGDRPSRQFKRIVATEVEEDK